VCVGVCVHACVMYGVCTSALTWKLVDVHMLVHLDAESNLMVKPVTESHR
jgi:hypothetical protein